MSKVTGRQQQTTLELVAAWMGRHYGDGEPVPTGQHAAYRGLGPHGPRHATNHRSRTSNPLAVADVPSDPGSGDVRESGFPETLEVDGLTMTTKTTPGTSPATERRDR